MKTKKNAGQALLIIVLILAVGLTIGLSVVSRSITDVRISQEQEESARAFSAAEAGIEAKLSGQNISDYGGFKINVESKSMVVSNSFIFPDPVKKGETQTVWLVGHNEAGELDPSVSPFGVGATITLFWGNQGTDPNQANTPALEATLIFQEDSDFKTKKFTADPNNIGRRNSNEFGEAETGDYSLQDKKLSFRKVLSDADLPDSGLYALRLKLVYNDTAHFLGMEASGAVLSEQGQCYESTASQTETGGISSKVQQCNLYKTPPLLFDYVIFSEEDLDKNN